MDKPKRKQYEFYKNEEDRINARRKAKLMYSKKPWFCETCNITILVGHKSKHLKSNKHARNGCPTCSEDEE